MNYQYLDPATPKRLDGWYSPILGQDMPIVTYGDRGRPLLLFPTAAADFLENERFFLVKSVEPFIQQGRLRLFSIDSINRQAWMDNTIPVPEQARRQALYMRYVEEEVVPYIRTACGGAARIGTAGASFGAFHAANALLRRPDLFDTLIAMSGFYDLAPDYLHGYSDDNCYYNNPVWYLPGLSGHYLDLLRRPVPDHHRDRAGRLRGAAGVAAALRDSGPQGHPARPRPVGSRREPRLALVAEDAPALRGQPLLSMRLPIVSDASGGPES